MSKQFKVICLKTGKFYNDTAPWDDLVAGGVDTPMLFDDGSVAESYANDCTKSFDVGKWQVRPHIVDDRWKEREARRFYTGEYIPPPWESESWFYGTPAWGNHFVHLSIELSDTRIAFTPNQEMGLADRQKRIKPGSYLKEYFGNVLSQDEIREYVAEFSVRHEDVSYQLARTADEIEEIYRNGPRSCMGGPTHSNSFATKIHPVRAYAGPDLAVAYLAGDPDAKEANKKICDVCEEHGSCTGSSRCNPRPPAKYSARAVIWPERKIYGRIYGDADRLSLALKLDGYEKGNIANARLSRIETVVDGREALVVPYIDGPAQRLRDNGQYLVVDAEGSLACSQHGYAFDSRVKCCRCGKKHQENNHFMQKDGNNRPVCDRCWRDHRAQCATSGYWFDKAIAIDYWGQSSMLLHPRFVTDVFAICEASKQLILVNRVGTLAAEARRLADGRYVHEKLYDEFTASMKKCDRCGHHAPDGKFKCISYGKCYGQPDWTNVGGILYHRSQLRSDSSFAQGPFVTYDEALKAANEESARKHAENEARRQEQIRENRRAAQRARRERERAEGRAI